MAKYSTSISFKNATIDANAMTVTEIDRDDMRVYDLNKVLRELDGVEGLSISFRSGGDRKPDEGVE
jgi:hypothetical protein